MNVPRLGMWKFASCDGCQLTLLDCEDELLTLAEHVKINTLSGSLQHGDRWAVRRVDRRGLDHHARR